MKENNTITMPSSQLSSQPTTATTITTRTHLLSPIRSHNKITIQQEIKTINILSYRRTQPNQMFSQKTKMQMQNQQQKQVLLKL